MGVRRTLRNISCLKNAKNSNPSREKSSHACNTELRNKSNGMIPAIVRSKSEMNTHLIPYEQLMAYAVGELGQAPSAIITDHVASCADCAMTVTRFRAVRAITRADHTELPPAATLVRAQNIFSHRPICKSLESPPRASLNSRNGNRSLAHGKSG